MARKKRECQASQKKEGAECRKGEAKIENATIAREDQFYYHICKQSVSRLRICPITRTICFSKPWVETELKCRMKNKKSIKRDESLYKKSKKTSGDFYKVRITDYW